MTTASGHTLRVIRDTTTGHLWLDTGRDAIELLPHEWLELRATGDAELPAKMQAMMNVRAMAHESALADLKRCGAGC